ncbi:MAG: sensor histidine kinase [Actinomycetota bacterium]
MQRNAVADARGRPYDRDVVTGRLILFGGLGAYIAAVYTAVVVGVAALAGAEVPNTGLSVLATAIVATSFDRVKRRSERLANRIVHGERATPYEVLSGFSRRMAETYAGQDLLPDLARAVAEGTGAAEAVVWLRVEDELTPAASWPQTARFAARRKRVEGDTLPVFAPGVRAVAVRHEGDLLGAITVVKGSGEELTATEGRLLDDVASHSGQVLRNVRLGAALALRLEEISERAAELRASRRRIVAAQDDERRRLERDIHDGAQQHLVALVVKLRVARSLLEKDVRKARASIAEAWTLTQGATVALRDLARGIYPGTLVRGGPAAALRAQTRGAPVPVVVKAEHLGRVDPDVEAATYFCCLEAVQNAVKHAGACRVTVRLSREKDHLVFTVADDGTGFDPASVARGAGLQNIEDRLAAAGGTVQIVSAPGAGTTVEGRMPIKAAGPSRGRGR